MKWLLPILMLVAASCTQTKQQTVNPCTTSDLPTGENAIDTTEKLCFDNLIYPVRFLIHDTSIARIYDGIDYSNEIYRDAGIQFEVDTIIYREFPTLEEMSDRGYRLYDQISAEIDDTATLSIIVGLNRPDICKEQGDAIICHRTGGWSYTANRLTHNLVLARDDLYNPWIMAHEIGHFFGLHHTFETRYGVENPDGSNGETAGDLVKDTPADPGSVYEIFVSFYDCEMYYGEYKPQINNIMAYYKPCWMQDYEITPGQQERVAHFANTIHKHKARVVENCEER